MNAVELAFMHNNLALNLGYFQIILKPIDYSQQYPLLLCFFLYLII